MASTGTQLVLAVIASLDGGYNGLDPNQRLGITVTSDTTATYTLTDASGTVQRFTVTVTPA